MLAIYGTSFLDFGRPRRWLTGPIGHRAREKRLRLYAHPWGYRRTDRRLLVQPFGHKQLPYWVQPAVGVHRIYWRLRAVLHHEVRTETLVNVQGSSSYKRRALETMKSPSARWK